MFIRNENSLYLKLKNYVSIYEQWNCTSVPPEDVLKQIEVLQGCDVIRNATAESSIVWSCNNFETGYLTEPIDSISELVIKHLRNHMDIQTVFAFDNSDRVWFSNDNSGLVISVLNNDDIVESFNSKLDFADIAYGDLIFNIIHSKGSDNVVFIERDHLNVFQNIKSKLKLIIDYDFTVSGYDELRNNVFQDYAHIVGHWGEDDLVDVQMHDFRELCVLKVHALSSPTWKVLLEMGVKEEELFSLGSS